MGGWQGSAGVVAPKGTGRSQQMVEEAERRRIAERMATAARAYLDEGTPNHRAALESTLLAWSAMRENP